MGRFLSKGRVLVGGASVAVSPTRPSDPSAGGLLVAGVTADTFVPGPCPGHCCGCGDVECPDVMELDVFFPAGGGFYVYLTTASATWGPSVNPWGQVGLWTFDFSRDPPSGCPVEVYIGCDADGVLHAQGVEGFGGAVCFDLTPAVTCFPSYCVQTGDLSCPDCSALEFKLVFRAVSNPSSDTC